LKQIIDGVTHNTATSTVLASADDGGCHRRQAHSVIWLRRRSEVAPIPDGRPAASSPARTRRMGPSMRYLVTGLFILAACEPYTYDAAGNLVPYRGPASATSSMFENCGTPDEPKRCPTYRFPPRKQSLAPFPNYNDRTY